MLIILLAEMSDEHQRIRTRGRSETTEMTRSDIFLTASFFDNTDIRKIV